MLVKNYFRGNSLSIGYPVAKRWIGVLIPGGRPLLPSEQTRQTLISCSILSTFFLPILHQIIKWMPTSSMASRPQAIMAEGNA